MNDLQLKIALSIIPKVGPRLVRRLVSYAGGIDEVFRQKKGQLEKIPGIGEAKASLINRDKLMEEAEKECKYIRSKGIKALFYLDDDYPSRLRECEDGPIILYYEGEVDFNTTKTLSIVGTRNATEYGRSTTEEIVAYFAFNYPDILIISGLAFGIDITAHKAALKNNLKTIAVLGHGLNFVYPSLHSRYAKKIIEYGALVTEFSANTKPDPGNFVSRNRIIAGLADATLVVESGIKGGALITADIANSYNRDVFAVPGKGSDVYSKGCNNLIKSNKAALVATGNDIDLAMGWQNVKNKDKTIQRKLFQQLTTEEENILQLLDDNKEMYLDEMSIALNLPVSKVSACLLNMEFNGMVRSMPGKCYVRL
jgi:DNA processing protein